MHEPEIDFGVVTDEYWAMETEARGYCGSVSVKMPDGRRYRLTFYDTVRLTQTVEEDEMVADPGLIVIQKVTESEIRKSIARLTRERFFDTLAPI